jgi:hypothetical protein
MMMGPLNGKLVMKTLKILYLHCHILSLHSRTMLNSYAENRCLMQSVRARPAAAVHISYLDPSSAYNGFS